MELGIAYDPLPHTKEPSIEPPAFGKAPENSRIFQKIQAREAATDEEFSAGSSIHIKNLCLNERSSKSALLVTGSVLEKRKPLESNEQTGLNGLEEVFVAKLADKVDQGLSLVEQLNILTGSTTSLQPEVELPLETAITARNVVTKNVTQGQNTFVWYASFGSNMYRPRLMCYIMGGKVEGGLRTSEGLPDKTPPSEEFWFSARHRLFFGRTYSETWGRGGNAFLDPSPVVDDDLSFSYLRAYKITLEQFNGILVGENNKKFDQTGSFLSMDDIEMLKKRCPPCLDAFEGVWYGTVLYLGEKDGAPILTITCSVEDVKKYKSGDLPCLQPANAYRDIIIKGLLDEGMDEASAIEYVAARC